MRNPASVAALIAAAVLLPPPAEAQDRAARLDAELRKRSPLSAAVLVARADTVLLERAYGLAERELGVPLATDHIFRIGSLTKPLTAAAVVVRAQQGQWRLSDSVCAWLDACPAGWDAVTLEHLLRHRSGVPDLFGAMAALPVDATGDEVRRVLRESKTDLVARPGDRYAYSNFNYVLLGYSLEQATGRPWEAVLTETLFEPLGMSRTAYDDVWAIVPGRARGYRIRDGSPAHIEYDDHAAYAAGGLYSSLGDLRRFAFALFGGELLEPAWLERSLTPPEGGSYGYGWQVTRFHDRRVYNHTGGIPGFSSHIAYYPEESLLVIVLSNLEDGDARGTACDLAAAAFGLETTPEDPCGTRAARNGRP